jgi:glycosyltransferase involved in cell wall biosynthesis
MRINFVVPTYARDPIGGIRVVYGYANHLAARGHEVGVVHVARFRRRPGITDGRPRRQLEEIVGGWRDLRRGAPNEVSWQHVDSRVDLHYVGTLGPSSIPDGDIVVATAWQTADGVAGLPPGKGVGWYLIQHHETWSGRASRVDATWRLPLRKIVIAPWLLRRAQEMGVNAIRVPNAIDTTKFRITTSIERRRSRIAMLASEWAWKGRDDGIAALRLVREQIPSVEAVLFGAGPHPAGLEPWIEYRQDPAQRVLVDDIYNGSAIYLCPSHFEGWHLPPAEAMACGTAVVSTDIDGVADYAIDGKTALLAPVGDVAGLADRMVGLLEDSTRRVDLARAGHAHIQQFTWDASTDALETAFAGSVEAVTR